MAFRDPADPLPPTARPLRPTLRPLPLPPPEAPRDRATGRRRVVVTLGTVFPTESGDLLGRLVAGVRELAVDVVVTVGRTVEPAVLGAQPSHVRVRRFAPLDDLLTGCAAVVTHAGSGTVVAALAHGVPLVCVPLGADQPLNAARCTTLGVGLELDPVTLTPGDARDAAGRVLREPGFRAAGRALAAQVARHPAPERAVGLLEELAARP